MVMSRVMTIVLSIDIPMVNLSVGFMSVFLFDRWRRAGGSGTDDPDRNPLGRRREAQGIVRVERLERAPSAGRVVIWANGFSLRHRNDLHAFGYS
jgi:hypothetical protein